jgi:hypothetical protein
LRRCNLAHDEDILEDRSLRIYILHWFCPVGMGQTRVTKEFWEKEVGPIEIREIEDKWLIEELQPFLQKKRYTKPDRKYLVITDFGMTFLFSKSC